DLGRCCRLVLEPEIALVLGQDLTEAPRNADQALAAVHSVHPGYELVDIHTDVQGLIVPEAIADSGWNTGYLLGEGVPLAGIDLNTISVRVRSSTGALDASGTSDMLLNGPAGCLTWLAERLIRDGEPLR